MKILFACIGNAGRSQMAEGFARAYARTHAINLDIRSGGSRPASRIDANAVAAMAELGIDISHGTPKGFDEAWVAGCDLIITMGCGDDACPAFLGKRILDWPLPDPKGKSLDEVRAIRDDIAKRVRAVLSGIA